METSNQSNWQDMAKVFLLVLKNRMHAKSALVKKEIDNGMIEANLSESDYSSMVCFKCGGKGHSAKSCVKAEYSMCSICRKAHHVNSHEAYMYLKNRKDTEAKMKGKVNNNRNIKYKNNINVNDTRIQVSEYDEEGFNDTVNLDILFEGMKSDLENLDEYDKPYIYEDIDDTYEPFGGMTEIIDTKIINKLDIKADINSNKLINRNNQDEIINRLSNIFVKKNSKKNIKQSKTSRSNE